MPRIENWTLISLSANENYQVTGQSYDDVRCKDGTGVRTSTLKSINFETGEVQTLNTKYKLGRHANGTTQLGKPEQNTQVDATN